LDFPEDQVGIRGPDERLGLFIIVVQILVDRLLQTWHAFERPAANPSTGKLRKATPSISAGQIHRINRVLVNRVLAMEITRCEIVSEWPVARKAIFDFIIE
jgi:hypothetical protein